MDAVDFKNKVFICIILKISSLKILLKLSYPLKERMLQFHRTKLPL